MMVGDSYDIGYSNQEQLSGEIGTAYGQSKIEAIVEDNHRLMSIAKTFTNADGDLEFLVEVPA